MYCLSVICISFCLFLSIICQLLCSYGQVVLVSDSLVRVFPMGWNPDPDTQLCHIYLRILMDRKKLKPQKRGCLCLSVINATAGGRIVSLRIPALKYGAAKGFVPGSSFRSRFVAILTAKLFL